MCDLVSTLPDLIRSRFNTNVIEGYFPVALFHQLRWADENLLIVGNRHKSRMAVTAFGSKAMDVVSAAPADVLVLPTGGSWGL